MPAAPPRASRSPPAYCLPLLPQAARLPSRSDAPNVSSVGTRLARPELYDGSIRLWWRFPPDSAGPAGREDANVTLYLRIDRHGWSPHRISGGARAGAVAAACGRAGAADRDRSAQERLRSPVDGTGDEAHGDRRRTASSA